MISGHMDVVEAKPADWKRDPFTPGGRERLSVRPRRHRHEARRHARHRRADRAAGARAIEPRRDIVIEFSGDEETTMKTSAHHRRQAGERRAGAQHRRRRRHAGRDHRQAALFHLAGRGEDLRRLPADRHQPGRPLLGAARATTPSTSWPRRCCASGAYHFKPEAQRPHPRLFRQARPSTRTPKTGAAMRAFAANPADEAAIATLTRRSRHGRQDRHHLRRDHDQRRPRAERPAAARRRPTSTAASSPATSPPTIMAELQRGRRRAGGRRSRTSPKARSPPTPRRCAPTSSPR